MGWRRMGRSWFRLFLSFIMEFRWINLWRMGKLKGKELGIFLSRKRMGRIKPLWMVRTILWKLLGQQLILMGIIILFLSTFRMGITFSFR